MPARSAMSSNTCIAVIRFGGRSSRFFFINHAIASSISTGSSGTSVDGGDRLVVELLAS